LVSSEVQTRGLVRREVRTSRTGSGIAGSCYSIWSPKTVRPYWSAIAIRSAVEAHSANSRTPFVVQKDRSQAREAAARRCLAPWRSPLRRPDSRRRRASSPGPESNSGIARAGRPSASREGRGYVRRTPVADSERRLVGQQVPGRARGRATPNECLLWIDAGGHNSGI